MMTWMFRVSGGESIENRGVTKNRAPDWPDAWWQWCLGDVSTEMLN